MTSRQAILIAVSLCAFWTGLSIALPTELTPAQFASMASGHLVITETFDEFTQGLYTSPLTLANGVYIDTGQFPYITSGEEIFCPNSSNCIIDSLVLDYPRTFTNFPVGTIAWGVEVRPISPVDVFHITVIGASGTLSYSSPLHATSFLAFADPGGLTTASLVNLGFSGGIANYGLDNAAVVVPEPATLALLSIGLAGLGLSRRKQ